MKLLHKASQFIVNQLSHSSCLVSWPPHTLACTCSSRSLHDKSSTLVSTASGQNRLWPWAENMLRAHARPNSAHLPRTESRAHTHLVCTSEMRRKVSRSSLYQSGAGVHVWFTSCLCSKWTVTLLTSKPLLDVPL